VPLLEGEEQLRFLNIQANEISRIDNLVSLPNLNHIDISYNKI